MLKDKTVSSIMTSKIVSCAPDSNYRVICRKMRDHLISCILVIDQKDCVGVITEQDIVHISATDGNHDLFSASDIMSSPVRFINENATITEASDSLEEHHVRRLAVENDNKDLVGLITQSDLLHVSFEYVRNYAKTLEREVKQRTAELDRLSGLKDDFLGMAAHDLRNPLTIIRAWTELMEHQLDDTASPVAKDGTTDIIKQVDNMLALINDLLDVSKIDSGNVKWNMVVVNPYEVVSSAFRANQLTGEKKGITMTNNVPPTLPEVYGDYDRLYSVADNLISNALKYSRKGDTVTLSAKTYDNRMQIDVHDTGQGIAADQLDCLFKEFSRAGSKPTSGEQSTGLGLAIVKKVITQHKGNVRVTSELNKGSTFSFELPVHNPDKQDHLEP